MEDKQLSIIDYKAEGFNSTSLAGVETARLKPTTSEFRDQRLIGLESHPEQQVNFSNFSNFI